MNTLTGYTDQENSYTVENYPYGFRTKTKKRYWIESKNKQGQRLCEQTLNPKTEKWNQPKKGTYKQIIIMGLDQESSHVKIDTLTNYSNPEEIIKFENEYKEFLTDFQLKQIKFLKALNNAYKHIKITIGETSNNKPHQTQKEQLEIVNKCFRYEYNKLK